jgi:hypothetical protein
VQFKSAAGPGPLSFGDRSNALNPNQETSIMTKFVRLACALAAVAICSTAVSSLAVADDVDLSGTWEFSVELAGQQGTPEFTLKQDGEALSGKYKGQFGEADVTGKIKDAELEITFELEPGQKALYSGTVEKDGTLKGKVDYAGQASGTWTGKRKKTE